MKISRRAALFGSAATLVANSVVPARADTLTMLAPKSRYFSEVFDGWLYSAALSEGTLSVNVNLIATSRNDLEAFDRANRAAVSLVQEPIPVTVIFRRPLTEADVVQIAQSAGIRVESYYFRTVDERGMVGSGSGRDFPVQLPVPTAPGPGGSPPSINLAVRSGLVTMNTTADAQQLVTLFADDRVFTGDAAKVIGAERGRTALTAIDPAAATLPIRYVEAFPPIASLYSRLEDFGIAPNL